jgi:hypothetical protein
MNFSGKEGIPTNLHTRDSSTSAMLTATNQQSQPSGLSSKLLMDFVARRR